MTKEKSFLLALVCQSLPCLATYVPEVRPATVNVTIDSLQWTLVDSTQTATLNRYGKNNDRPVVPEGVVYDGKNYKVVAIESQNNNGVFISTIKEVSLPQTLKVVGNMAFHECRNLNKLVLPESVDSIGSYAFNFTSFTTLNVQAPIAPKLHTDAFPSWSCEIGVVYVPNGSGASYRSADRWKNLVIIDGEGTKVSVILQSPGELASEILKQTDNLSNVNVLKISGSLNDTDISKIYRSMPNLIEIDLSETDLKELPADMLSGKLALRKVVLPSGLARIEGGAFYDCSALEDVNIPDSVSEIEDNVFNGCSSLKNIVLPENITTIDHNAFNGCRQLESIKLPNMLQTISYETFRGCTNLSEVILPNTLKTIYSAAFSGTNLTSITLPESLVAMSSPFQGCANLNEITCLAILPPTIGSLGLFGSYNSPDMSQKVLKVPGISVNDYKLAEGWDVFTNVQPLDYMPNSIRITSDFTINIPDSVPNMNVKDLAISYVCDYENFSYSSIGHLTVNGNGSLSINNFSLPINNVTLPINNSSTNNTKTTLINNAQMSADNVSIDMEVLKDNWVFFSLPFDAKVSDVECLKENTLWVIRKYSGEARANAETGNTWQNMTGDSILHANEGYILQCTYASDNSSLSSIYASYATFRFTAMDNANKNAIFASANKAVAMKEYPAESTSNRSWNLIGNPYPAYFDIRFSDFTAPVTIWNDGVYEAYSPMDDSYILSPGEAFFVQRPTNQAEIVFDANGRQHTTDVRTIGQTQNNVAMAAINAERDVYNLTLAGDDAADRTRFVINPRAEIDYDPSHDAAKMFSEDLRSSQLFTIEADGDYAINERPLGDGIIRIGVKFAQNGTYTIALKDGKKATLVDEQEGRQVELDGNGYTFSAKAGEARNRFYIRLADKTTGIEWVDAADESDVVNRIYTLDGRLLMTTMSKLADIHLPQGSYIVKSGNHTRKVNVCQ